MEVTMQAITINGVTMNNQLGVNMLNPTPAEINRICNRMTVKSVVCDDNGSLVEVFALKEGGFLVSVENGDYAYWTSDRDVAIRLWAEYQDDAFWKEALDALGGETDGDEYIALHQYDAYDGFYC
jgi:hypothetical protein